MSWTKAQRAGENRAYVRGHLSQRQPAFAAAPTAAQQTSRALPARAGSRTAMIAHPYEAPPSDREMK